MNFSLSWVDVFLVIPLIVLFITSIIPITMKLLRGNREINPFVTLTYSWCGLISAVVSVIGLYGSNHTAFGGTLVFDSLTAWISVTLIICVGIFLLLSYESISICKEQFSEMIFLVFNALIGMIILSMANDLLVVFIGIEMMSLALYLMIALSREQKIAKEAAFKYFVLGSFAAAFFLYGISFIYGSTTSTQISQIASVSTTIGSQGGFLVGGLLLFLGLGFKLSLFPFYSWTPDVYQGSATPITGFMAAAVKAVTFIVLVRLFLTSQGFINRNMPIIMIVQWLSVLTMIVGNVGALLQNNLKRMLAYSSIAHSGYAMAAVIALVFISPDNHVVVTTISSIVFYIVSYAVMTIGSFAFISLFEKNENQNILIDDLQGLSSRHSWFALCFSILLLSLAGLPPTLGFFGKFYVFSAALNQGLLWLVICGVINSVVGVCYYLRPVMYMYMKESNISSGGFSVQKHRKLTELTVSVSALIVFIVGFCCSSIITSMRESISKMF